MLMGGTRVWGGFFGSICFVGQEGLSWVNRVCKAFVLYFGTGMACCLSGYWVSWRGVLALFYRILA